MPPRTVGLQPVVGTGREFRLRLPPGPAASRNVLSPPYALPAAPVALGDRCTGCPRRMDDLAGSGSFRFRRPRRVGEATPGTAASSGTLTAGCSPPRSTCHSIVPPSPLRTSDGRPAQNKPTDNAAPTNGVRVPLGVAVVEQLTPANLPPHPDALRPICDGAAFGSPAPQRSTQVRRLHWSDISDKSFTSHVTCTA